jgi:GT2 family glycosyltransferase
MPPLAGVPAVWAIIVCYNGGSLLRKCLESLLRSTTPVAVVVIDNGSTDGSIRLIQKEFPAIRLVLSPENLGFGRANNAASNWRCKGVPNTYFCLTRTRGWNRRPFRT